MSLPTPLDDSKPLDVNAEKSPDAGGSAVSVAQSEPAKNSRIILKWSSDADAPLVMLFGWAGCQDRYLAKYSQIYEEQNYSILRFTVPVAKIKCFAHYRRFARDVYEKTLNLGAGEPRFPIYFHVFSMNGCSLFAALWDMLPTMPNGEAVVNATRGIIFDSCPANVTPWQSADAVSFAMMPHGGAQRTVYRYLLFGIFSAHRAFIWLRSAFEADVYEQHMCYFYMLQHATKMPCRQLYLYSRADTICSAESIEYFRSVQKERTDGVELHFHCWEDSSHVEHLRKYPQDYADECLRFVGGADSAKGVIKNGEMENLVHNNNNTNAEVVSVGGGADGNDKQQ